MYVLVAGAGLDGLLSLDLLWRWPRSLRYAGTGGGALALVAAEVGEVPTLLRSLADCGAGPVQQVARRSTTLLRAALAQWLSHRATATFATWPADLAILVGDCRDGFPRLLTARTAPTLLVLDALVAALVRLDFEAPVLLGDVPCCDAQVFLPPLALAQAFRGDVLILELVAPPATPPACPLAALLPALDGVLARLLERSLPRLPGLVRLRQRPGPCVRRWGERQKTAERTAGDLVLVVWGLQQLLRQGNSGAAVDLGAGQTPSKDTMTPAHQRYRDARLRLDWPEKSMELRACQASALQGQEQQKDLFKTRGCNVGVGYSVALQSSSPASAQGPETRRLGNGQGAPREQTEESYLSGHVEGLASGWVPGPLDDDAGPPPEGGLGNLQHKRPALPPGTLEADVASPTGEAGGVKQELRGPCEGWWGQRGEATPGSQPDLVPLKKSNASAHCVQIYPSTTAQVCNSFGKPHDLTHVGAALLPHGARTLMHAGVQGKAPERRQR